MSDLESLMRVRLSAEDIHFNTLKKIMEKLNIKDVNSKSDMYSHWVDWQNNLEEENKQEETHSEGIEKLTSRVLAR